MIVSTAAISWATSSPISWPNRPPVDNKFCRNHRQTVIKLGVRSVNLFVLENKPQSDITDVRLNRIPTRSALRHRWARGATRASDQGGARRVLRERNSSRETVSESRHVGRQGARREGPAG